jgi:hypothetical protein
MGPQPGRRPMRLGNHVAGQELGQSAGVQLVALAGALGDHPQLAGMRQHDSRRVRFHQPQEPLVAGRGLDDQFERTEPLEKLGDPQFIVAAESS